jgi:hypothetical protein
MDGTIAWQRPRIRNRALASSFHAYRGAIVSRWVLGFAVAAFGCGSACAKEAPASITTTIDLKACKVVRKNSEGAIWRCRGLPGYPVYVAEGDDRMFVSVGSKPEKRRAAEQTLKPFNSIFQEATGRTTIEWRIPHAGKMQPYAAIIRYYTSSETAKGQVLVVSKISPKATCHAAYIDADANPDAIERARLASDTTVRSFDCRKVPVVEGAPGKTPL